MKYKVLHISPHLGGGVGTVLLSYLKMNKNSIKFEDYVYCLDSINDKSQKFLLNNNIIFEQNISKKIFHLLDVINKVDIVIIHWWNHPLLYEFLVKNKLPSCRLAIWSHISGNSEPQCFTPSLLEYPDLFIFTTPVSSKNSYIKDNNNFSTIWAGSDLSSYYNIKRKNSEFFSIGYIGTVDFSKIYKRILYICKDISIPNIKFTICGPGSSIQVLKYQVEKFNLKDKVQIVGQVEDIKSYLAEFDIFFYPLNKEHYGTCDLAIAEAMAAGVVPIVFDNEMEKSMVKNLFTGLVVSSENEFILALEQLCKNDTLLKKLSSNCKIEALERFSIDKTIFEWEKTLERMLILEKNEKQWKGIYRGNDIKPYQIFLESINEKREIFEQNNISEIHKLKLDDTWNSQTKGTLYHYSKFFDYDKVLKKWIQYLEKGMNET